MKAVAVFKNDRSEKNANKSQHAISLLRILESHLHDDVPSVAAAIDDFFQQAVKIVEENDLFRIVFALEKIAEAVELELVGIAFDALELRIHFASGAGVNPCSQLFHHR